MNKLFNSRSEFTIYDGKFGNTVFVKKGITLVTDIENTCFWYELDDKHIQIKASVKGVFMTVSKDIAEGRDYSMEQNTTGWELRGMMFAPVKDDAPKKETSRTMTDFELLVSVTIGRLYKKSPMWKQRLMWKLVKEWNSNRFKIGIGQIVRKELGEEKALATFREIANQIMNDTELLKQAIKYYKESNPCS